MGGIPKTDPWWKVRGASIAAAVDVARSCAVVFVAVATVVVRIAVAEIHDALSTECETPSFQASPSRGDMDVDFALSVLRPARALATAAATFAVTAAVLRVAAVAHARIARVTAGLRAAATFAAHVAVAMLAGLLGTGAFMDVHERLRTWSLPTICRYDGAAFSQTVGVLWAVFAVQTMLAAEWCARAHAEARAAHAN